MRELIIAFGLFLFIEGIFYALFPAKMKSILIKIKEINDKQLRSGGFIRFNRFYNNLVYEIWYLKT